LKKSDGGGIPVTVYDYAAMWLIVITSIVLSGVIAEHRGRSVRLWCWLGAIFGPVAPLAVALLRPVR
jgi:hypothetical protein